MQVLFLGGASEVGASCLAIELAGSWIVVDAGIRIGASDPLPDLTQLEDKQVRAIFVTHAHADHIGALPLLHQAFPHTPIYASRATGLLMEVMLADAVKIMERRALDEMELPLYQPDLVGRMLQLVRPLPTEAPVTLPEMPAVTIQASRAGHIAGAVSLSFEAPDGRIVVSGDLSLTEQRTVLPARTPPVDHPDLLVLESTYGTRLHANRKTEEARFAQAVADGIARGGHVLIPAFALGRGQEVLLILQDAMQKQQIPTFPLVVDGLVRRVCATYLLVPEALSPRLSRQIRHGTQPFHNRLARFVRDERDRERILTGPPACIVSSSGMLTGGPSAWYAARLAQDPSASILITGYQDEESPGRRLLDLAEHREASLEVGGKIVQVRCQVAKYSLSAHADSGELASYATALAPRQVALVHGDDEARAALRLRLTGTTVVLPQNGTAIQVSRVGRLRCEDIQAVAPVTFPTGIGAGRVLSTTHLPELWQALASLPALHVVTAREVAHIWYGEDSPTTSAVMDILREEASQRYFVQEPALEEAFRVQGTLRAARPLLSDELVGRILFLQVRPGSAQPVYCRAVVPVASVVVQLPKESTRTHAIPTRYPYESILDVIGPLPASVEEPDIARYIAELKRAAHHLPTVPSAQALARLCAEGAHYSLSDLCALVELDPADLTSRLALAKVLYQAPRLFAFHESMLDQGGEVLYQLAPEWEEALSSQPPIEQPGTALQQAIVQVLTRHLGEPPDLYRRSVHPETGEVTLAFHFPAVAKIRYAEALTLASAESGIPIHLHPHPHQGKLVERAIARLPAGLRPLRPVSLSHEQEIACVACAGNAEPAELVATAARFQEETGWQLSITVVGASTAFPVSRPALLTRSGPRTRTGVWDMQEAVLYAQQRAASLPGYLRVRVETGTRTLLLRFAFPEVAQLRYQSVADEIKATTGWHVRFAGESNLEELRAMVEQVKPTGLTIVDTISFYQDSHQAYVTCIGEATPAECKASQADYEYETGWQLVILDVEGLALAAPNARPQMTQTQAIEYAGQLLRGEPSLYMVGADDKRKVLWLHFQFPEVARTRFAEVLARITQETGWSAHVRKFVHKRALFEMAVGLLPPQLSIIGKKVVREEERTLQLTCQGQISSNELEVLQARFREETGWSLDLIVAASPGRHAISKPEQMNEAQALSYLKTQLSRAGYASCRIGVDTVRGTLLVRDQVKGVTTERRKEWQEETGWHIEVESRDPSVCIPQELFAVPIEVLAISRESITRLSAHRLTTVGQVLEQDERTLCSILRPEHLTDLVELLRQRGWLPEFPSEIQAEME
jgi:Cft2 family RNA processing exonuclease